MPKPVLLLFFLTEKPMGMNQLAPMLGVSQRTVLRYLEQLRGMGCQITREYSKYRVVEWPESIRKYKFKTV